MNLFKGIFLLLALVGVIITGSLIPIFLSNADKCERDEDCVRYEKICCQDETCCFPNDMDSSLEHSQSSEEDVSESSSEITSSDNDQCLNPCGYTQCCDINDTCLEMDNTTSCYKMIEKGTRRQDGNYTIPSNTDIIRVKVVGAGGGGGGAGGFVHQETNRWCVGGNGGNGSSGYVNYYYIKPVSEINTLRFEIGYGGQGGTCGCQLEYNEMGAYGGGGGGGDADRWGTENAMGREGQYWVFGGSPGYGSTFVIYNGTTYKSFGGTGGGGGGGGGLKANFTTSEESFDENRFGGNGGRGGGATYMDNGGLGGYKRSIQECRGESGGDGQTDSGIQIPYPNPGSGGLGGLVTVLGSGRNGENGKSGEVVLEFYHKSDPSHITLS